MIALDEDAVIACVDLVGRTDAGAVAVDGHLVDGTAWTAADAQKAGQCRWTRQGRRWEMGCAHSHVGNRAERRAEKRDARRKGGRR